MNDVPDHPDIRRLEHDGMPEDEVIYECYHCLDNIYKGDFYYIVDGHKYCEDCVDKQMAGYED